MTEAQEARSGGTLLVWEDGELTLEAYQNGFDAEEPHILASGTKAFAGVMALAAIEDGLFTLDERVAETITEWQGDPQKAKITVGQLLHLTSGLKTSIGHAPSYEAALNTPLVHAPGESFRYGNIALQVFGALLERKLAGEAPAAYLRRRFLAPLGMEINSWLRVGGDSNSLEALR